MDSKTLQILLFPLLMIISSCKSCKEQAYCREIKHTFQGTFRVTPDSDSLSIGDTMYLESNIPFTLKDVITYETVNFAGAENINFLIAFDKLLENNNVQYCGDCFELKPIAGSFVPHDVMPARNRNYVFSPTAGGYQFKLAIIPKEKGDFAFGISNSSQSYPKNDECLKANFQFKITDTDQHFYIFQAHRPGYVLTTYDKDHMYCFRVY